MPVWEAMERVMAEFYGVPTLSNDGAWEIDDGAYVSRLWMKVSIRCGCRS